MALDIRLVVTDLDGTLVSHGHTIPQENVRALKAVRERGIQVAICSGRDARNMSKIALDAGIPDCAILGLNGSYVLDKPNGALLSNVQIQADAARTCLDILIRYGGELIMCGDNYFGVYNAPKLEAMLRDPERDSYILTVDDVEMLYEMAAKGLNKFVYTERERPERLVALREEIGRVAGVAITSSWVSNIEIMPVGIDKGVAVKHLAGRLGIDMSQVMAFGDNDNDLPMITAAGYGVAMGNAIDSVRKVAWHVTDTNVNYGVAKALEKYVLS